MKLTDLCFLAALLAPALHATEPVFESQLFSKGTLIYSDDFESVFSKKHWEPRTKSWEIINGALVGKPDYDSAEEAMAALKRDHHLGMSPVIRLKDLPKKFVLHMRLQFEGKAFATGRPKFDIGHHVNTVTFNDGGYAVKLHGGERFSGEAPKIELNEWINVVLEFEEGRMWIAVNGAGQTIEHEQVSLQGHSELTFKTFADAPNRILFDRVRLWRID